MGRRGDLQVIREIVPRLFPVGFLLDGASPQLLALLLAFLVVGETGFEPATARPPGGGRFERGVSGEASVLALVKSSRREARV
jgi:hypothetical protein